MDVTESAGTICQCAKIHLVHAFTSCFLKSLGFFALTTWKFLDHAPISVCIPYIRFMLDIRSALPIAHGVTGLTPVVLVGHPLQCTDHLRAEHSFLNFNIPSFSIFLVGNICILEIAGVPTAFTFENNKVY